VPSASAQGPTGFGVLIRKDCVILSAMTPLNKEWLNVGLGIIVFLLPLLGFPRSFNTVVYMLVGFVIAVNALRALRMIYRGDRERRTTDNVDAPKI